MKHLFKINYLTAVFLSMLFLFSCSSSEDSSVEIPSSETRNANFQCGSPCGDQCTSFIPLFGPPQTQINCAECFNLSQVSNLPDQSYEWCVEVTIPLQNPISVSSFYGEISSKDELICMTGLEDGTYKFQLTLIDENGTCYSASNIKGINNCGPCYEVPMDPPCDIDWPCSAPIAGNDGCTIDIATDEIYNMIMDYVGPGLCTPEITLDITTCDGATWSGSSDIPDYWDHFQVIIDSEPVTDQYVSSISVPCGSTILINTNVTGCDSFNYQCYSEAKCKAECCDDCLTCGPSEFLFTEFRMRHQEVKMLRDLKLTFCDGTAPLDFGDAVVLIENNSGCSEEHVHAAADFNWGIEGPYVELEDYANELNEQLKLISNCENAEFSIYKDDFDEVVVSLSYFEGSDCPIRAIQYHEWGFGFEHDGCYSDSLSCLSVGISSKLKTNCGFCF